MQSGCRKTAGCAPAREPSGPDLPDARKGTPFPRIANCYGARLGHWTKGEELDVLAKFDLLIGGVNVGRTPEQRAKVAAIVAQLRKKNRWSLFPPIRWGRMAAR